MKGLILPLGICKNSSWFYKMHCDAWLCSKRRIKTFRFHCLSGFTEFCGPEFNYIWPQSRSLGQHVNSNSHRGDRPVYILESVLRAITLEYRLDFRKHTRALCTCRESMGKPHGWKWDTCKQCITDTWNAKGWRLLHWFGHTTMHMSTI